MSHPRSWPERYAVTVLTDTGGRHRFSVVTWLADAKAAVMAADELRRAHPDASVYDIAVEHLGPVGRDDEGMMVLDPLDLTDRQEF